MRDQMIYADTLPQAYHKALWVLEHSGEIVDCPNYNTRCKEMSLSFLVENPLKEPMISRLIPGGAEDLQQYCMEMLDGILDFEVEKGNWAYTYHERIAPQIPRIIEMLERDRSTRQAYIDVRREEDIYLDDPPCLTSIHYMIRPSVKHPNGQLNCYVQFRSNDAVRATFFNAYALIRLQEVVATELGVPVGTYYHRANSFHAYETTWPLLESYVKRIEGKQNLTYSYKDEWREQMEDATPHIMDKVRKELNK